jgi:glycosyltransferase involved in cell wall biosynthesis
MNPFFSIIIPAYERAELIGPTLASVQAQEEGDFECLVVDDGSKDGLGEVVESLGDDRFRYFWKENGERGAARNYGAARARGQYLNFVDSDDVLLPHHLVTAQKLIEKRDRPEIFHLAYNIKEGDKVVETRNSFPEVANDFLLKRWWLSCNGVFVRKDVAEAFPFEEDRRLSATEDSLLWLRIAARYPIYTDNTVTSTVIQHEGRSMASTAGEAFAEKAGLFAEVLRKDEGFMQQYGKHLPRLEANLWMLAALYAGLGGARRSGMGYLGKALGMAPEFLATRRFLGVVKHLF